MYLLVTRLEQRALTCRRGVWVRRGQRRLPRAELRVGTACLCHHGRQHGGESVEPRGCTLVALGIERSQLGVNGVRFAL
jgi:hypothetical protein